LNSSSEAFHEIWSLSMAIILTDISSIPPVKADDPTTRLHQSSSRTSPPIRLRGWWSWWFAQQDERIALRKIADDSHLLNDLGLTRDEALREATNPFWR
jgi:uncharacterized protein YjiS (DUF1127 family)